MIRPFFVVDVIHITGGAPKLQVDLLELRTSTSFQVEVDARRDNLVPLILSLHSCSLLPLVSSSVYNME
jgi:hypothetical protein